MGFIMSTNLDRQISSLQREIISADLRRAETPEGRLATAIARGVGPVIKTYVQREIAHVVDNAERQADKILSVITRELA